MLNELDNVLSLSDAGHVWVAATHVGCDPTTPVCSTICAQFQTRLRAIHATLADLFEPLPLGTQHDGLLDEFIETAPVTYNGPAESGDYSVFQVLGHDGELSSGCLLVLGSDYLTDDEKRAGLVRELGRLENTYWCVTCVFMDATGRLLERGTSSQTHTAWARSFMPLMQHCRVRLLLLSATTEHGERVNIGELIDLTSQAMLSDVVLEDPSSPRLLSNMSRESDVTLRTLGGRQLGHDADTLAEKHAACLAAQTLEHIQETVSSEEQSPPDLSGLVARAFNEDNPYRASLKLEATGARQVICNRAPVVTSRDFRAGLDPGKLAQGISLAGVPKRQWLDELAEFEFLVCHERLGRFEAAAAGRLRELSERYTGRLRKSLSRIAGRTSVRTAAASCRKVREETEAAFALQIREGSDPVLADNYEDLQSALERLPHLPSLILRALLIVILLAMTCSTISSAPHSALRTIGLWACGVMMGGTVLAASAVQFLAARAVHGALEDELTGIERRAQRQFCSFLASELRQWGTALTTSLREAEGRLDQMADALDSFRTQAAPPPEPTKARFVRQLPGAEQGEAIAQEYLHRSLEGGPSGALLTHVRDTIEKGTLSVLGSRVVASGVSSLVTNAARRQFRDWLHAHYQLAHFICETDPAASPRLRPERADWLKHRHVFLRGRAVENCLRDADASQQFWVVPTAIRSAVPDVEQVLPAHHQAVVVFDIVALSRQVDDQFPGLADHAIKPTPKATVFSAMDSTSEGSISHS